jgi:uncharacterized repeat protein (TIGR03803 family)
MLKGRKIGTALRVGCAVALLLPRFVVAQFVYEQLHSFTAIPERGFYPLVFSGGQTIMEASDGALYGTTENNGSTFGSALYQISKDGTGFTNLFFFPYSPNAPPVEGTNGALYGTTRDGGAVFTQFQLITNMGTVYRINKDGSGFSVILNFGDYTTGSVPLAPLIRASDGALYGTTYGGSSMFKISEDGTFAQLHFYTYTNYNAPSGPMIEGNDGILYGTAGSLVFKLNKDGSGYGVVLNGAITGGGGQPSLMQASNGFLYGTSYSGGSNASGTIFKLNKDGSQYAILHEFVGTNVHAFMGTNGDGARPLGAMVEGRDGILYGTTTGGGDYSADTFWGAGTVFKINKDGSGYAVVHRFGLNEGEGPNGLTLGSDGSLYGTTVAGAGVASFGTVFALRQQPVILPPIYWGTGVTLHFSALPGSTNQVRRVNDLAASWVTLTSIIAPTNAVAVFVDPNPPRPNAFYRIVGMRP